MEQHEILNWSNSFNVSKVSDVQRLGNLQDVLPLTSSQIKDFNISQDKTLVLTSIGLALASIITLL